MNHFVIGTAGHVDHGKTELVKALTGYETDRLKEEKERGMTIELGFAPIRLEDKMVSIVDVPGHEKLVKTMVSGASGIDMALLIIAANEGIMPQTIEHIHILSLLNVSSVIVVITKIDLVEDNELKKRIDDIKAYLKDTNYKEAIIHSVSSKEDIGITELRTLIIHEAKALKRDRNKELFLMPIDRVFTMKGHGTVVTGTILSGKIEEDDQIEIVEGDRKISSRVKNLQVHGNVQKEALSGQRCAINLNRVEKSLIKRGNVMIKPGTIKPTGWINAVIYNVNKKNSIKHNQRVRVNIGTVEVIGKLRVIGADIIKANEKGYASIKLDKPIIAIREDRFIIRTLTPITTIGGGIVLTHRSENLPRWNEESLHYLRLLEESSIKEIVEYTMNKIDSVFDIDTLYTRLYCNREAISNGIKELFSEGKVIKLDDCFISQNVYHNYTNRVTKIFQEYYKRNTFALFMNKEELRSKYFTGLKNNVFQALIHEWVNQKLLNQSGNKVAMDLEERTRLIIKNSGIREIEKLILDSGINCLERSILDKLRIKAHKIEDIIKFLEDSNRIRRLDNSLFIHTSNYKVLINTIERLFKQKEQLTVIEIRDALKIGRKRTINLLEYLDEQGFTKRIDNYRIRCH